MAVSVTESHPPRRMRRQARSLVLVDPATGFFVGGNFWDGRATGEKLGNPAADQAQGPFLNPVEQGLPDAACVVYQACTSGRYRASSRLSGDRDVCSIAWPRKQEMKALCSSENVTVPLSDADRAKVDEAFDDVALSIAAYEASPDVNQFSSKYDAYLAGDVELTAQEQAGLELFTGKAMCANCHTAEPGPNGEPPLFTDYTYDNLGGPKNPENPWYTQTAFNPDWVRLGRRGARGLPGNAPGLCGVRRCQPGQAEGPDPAQRRPAPRPGVREALRPQRLVQEPEEHRALLQHAGCAGPRARRARMHFRPTPTRRPRRCSWDAGLSRRSAENVNTTELGNLGLTDAEEDAIVAFLKTLSDGFVPPKGNGQGRP